MLRNPRFFAFLLIAAGVGVLAHFGAQWSQLPAWSEAEIEQSVALNLALELQHRGPHLRPEGERLDDLRRTLRAEVEGEIRRERHELERWMGFGLILCVLGAVTWFKQALAARLRLD
jgi:hypothetical protein